ncbi:MAG TPA: hypothetical protein PKK81_13060, partial [Nitrospira sp.]|nr:hypothetical protein [Nitrospira sp.]
SWPSTSPNSVEKALTMWTSGASPSAEPRNHQDLPEVVAGPVARLTRIFKLTEFLHQTDSRSTHFRRPKDASRRVFERVHKMAA